jgi:3-hydroxyacyl-[acyl-carrier-protein] dehydratase
VSEPVPADPIALGLPHREPFIFIDAVVALTPGKSAHCTKRFAASEPFFRGHFPGDPLVPGVLMAEALAQTAGLAAGQPGRTFHLSAIRGMKFLAPVRPDEELQLFARKTATVGALLQFEVTARLGEQAVVEGMLVLAEATISRGA